MRFPSDGLIGTVLIRKEVERGYLGAKYTTCYVGSCSALAAEPEMSKALIDQGGHALAEVGLVGRRSSRCQMALDVFA
jgi:hypothetical protein